MRLLESASRSMYTKPPHDIHDETTLFIRPGYTFSVVDHLITNFHVPGSSLMCLVDAFLQSKRSRRGILELYALARDKQFKFYSFGDAMVII